MRIRKAGALATLCAFTLVACGGGDDATDGGPGPGAGAEENRVQIGMTEFAFGMAEEVTGGNITLEFINSGELPHEAAFGSIAGDRDLDDVMKALRSEKEPKWFEDLAGIPVLDPGATTSMTRELDPGRYIFLCFLPVPETGVPHVTEGMVQLFDAEGTSEAEGPQPDLTITATDEGFEVPEVPSGTQAIELVNDGTKPHEFAIFSLEPGKTERDIDRWFGSGFEAEKPAVFPGGMQSIEPGTSVVVEMTFEFGRSYIVQDFENELEAEFEVQ